ncbi:hypothetical protein JP28_03940 [Gallibacterium anatis]|uniref:hypothetical protein n=1 Tax=Gallibacterium anatis TaxID=750 RepID=UPI000530DD45|nr:hypothetical protein [Gallibacterium anatis]KGQ44627.1 hypothetical protein JP28_03940 [Gallibacterium anatis]KGQ47470.1 hypothetical protein IO46_13125 [Gallibacterium anatis]KGQ53037.1 hypothetical protein IO44_11405 [Gallibacterium anatis str. Avicor]
MSSLTKSTNTTIRIAGERKQLLDAFVVAIVNRLHQPVKSSEVVHFILDTHLNPSLIEQFVQYYEGKMKNKEKK